MTAVPLPSTAPLTAPSTQIERLPQRERPRDRRRLRARISIWPTVASLVVLGGAVFPFSPLRDAATGRAVAGVSLALPSAYVAFAPFCDVLDTLTLFSARQHVALFASILFALLLWRSRVRHVPTQPRRWVSSLKALATTFLIVVGVYAVGLAPRPVAALAVADPDVVAVDFHSHTAASHDSRRGFTAERNRRWHHDVGFDVAYITDHRSFAAVADAELNNPRHAGDGTTLLSGIETRYRGQHLNFIGVDAQSGAAFLPGQIGEAAVIDGMRRAPNDALIVLTVPARVDEVPHLRVGTPGAVAAIELSDASPRGLDQLDSARDQILRIADSLNLAVVAGSDNHGWSNTAAAWTLIRIPNWRHANASELHARIASLLRARGRMSSWVVERSRTRLSSVVALAMVVPIATWTMLAQISWPERWSWLVWIWGFAAVQLLRRRYHIQSRNAAHSSGRARRKRGPRDADSALGSALCIAILVTASALRTGRADAQDTAAVQGARVTVTVFGGEGAASRPLDHAVVRSRRLGAQTDSAGVALLVLPLGPHSLIASRIGFAPDSLSLVLATDTTVTFHLREQVTRIATVVVTAARGERRIEDEPTRIEVLAGEDVAEKTQMRPANPTSLLSEIPGVRVQSTSPALGGAGVRLQGLRGRYTLLLADGLPLYGSASEGLGFLQVPPLDLAQAEVIKGPVTALYGPTALGGVVNLVSRRPPRDGKRDDELLINQTSQRGTDAMLWSANRLSDRWGYTFIGGAHRQSERDVDRDGWADVPAFRRGEIRPRLFWTGAGGRSAMFTLGTADEHRTSGGITPNGGVFPVGANTRRADVGAVIHLGAGSGLVTIRTSANRQWQDRQFGDSAERDHRGTALAEVSWERKAGRHEALLGGAVQHDALTGTRLPNAEYSFVTTSAFAQDTYAAGRRLSLATSVRLDRHRRYGTFVSPRFSALVRVTRAWSARLSAAGGAFAPTPLVEEADGVGLARVRMLAGLSAERLQYASFDLNGALGPVELNGTVYRSSLAHPVVVDDRAPGMSGVLLLVNAPSPTRTDGAELFAVYNREPLAMTALYSFTRSREWSPDLARRVAAPLTPRHAAGVDIAFDEDESGTRVGLELFYTGRQSLADNPYRTTGVPYATVGLLASQRIGRASLFVNAENLTDVRQTRFDLLVRPQRNAAGAWVTDQWAPLEGRIVNAGIRVKL